MISQRSDGHRPFPLARVSIFKRRTAWVREPTLLREAHDAIVGAIEEVLRTGPRTGDLGGAAKTVEVGDAIAALIAS